MRWIIEIFMRHKVCAMRANGAINALNEENHNISWIGGGKILG